MLPRIGLCLFLAALHLAAQDVGHVILDGRELFTVKVGRPGFTPRERADNIDDNILHVASDPRRSLADVRVVRAEGEIMLIVGRVVMFAVNDEDGRLEGKPAEILFAERKTITLNAMRQYRDRRRYWPILRAVLLGLCVVFAVVAAVLLLSAAYRRTADALDHYASAHGAEARTLTSVLILRSLIFLRSTLRIVVITIGVGILFTAISVILSLIPATSGYSDTIASTVGGVVSQAASALVAYLPNLLVLILIGLLTYGVIRVARLMADLIGTSTVKVGGFHPDWAKPTYDLVRILVILFAVVVAFPYLPGGDSAALKGVSIFIGVLVSLGSGSAMGNVVSGVILTYMRPFLLGDRVRIADTEGDVMQRSLLVTRIRTIKNVDVIVPNSAVLGAHIINYSANAAEGKLILNTTVTIGYDAPWRRVHEALIKAALNTRGVLAQPSPFVFQTSLNDYHVSYQINAFTADAPRMADIYSDLHTNIQEEFNKAGLEIMSPAYHSVRDGNTVTIPAEHRPSDYVPPAFRVENRSSAAAAGGSQA